MIRLYHPGLEAYHDVPTRAIADQYAARGWEDVDGGDGVDEPVGVPVPDDEDVDARTGDGQVQPDDV